MIYFDKILHTYSLYCLDTGMHSGDKASPIVYFTLIVGEHCSHMMINRTLEHVHHNVLMISSFIIVNALYPNVALGYPHFSYSKIQDFF